MVKFFHRITNTQDLVDEYCCRERDVDTILHYCENCNTEIVGNWSFAVPYNNEADFDWAWAEEKRYKDFSKDREVLEFLTMKRCPYCGEPFVDKFGHHIYFMDWTNSETFEDAAYIKRKGNKSAREKLDIAYAITRLNIDTLVAEHPNSISVKSDSIGFFRAGYCNDGYLEAAMYADMPGWIPEGWESGHSLEFFDQESLGSKLQYARNCRDTKYCHLSTCAKEVYLEDKVLKLIDLIRKDFTPTTKILPQKTSEIKSDVEKLKEYLKEIISLETSVYTLKERLKKLYDIEPEMSKDADGAKKQLNYYYTEKLLLPYQDEINSILEEKKRLEIQKADINISLDMFPIPEMVKPTRPEAPGKPCLEKPGFFNKKRVLAENAAKEEQYKKEMAAYEADLEIYEQKSKEYIDEYRKHRENQQKQYDAAYNAAAEKAEAEKQAKLQQVEQSLKEARGAYEKAKAEALKSAAEILPSECEAHMLIKKEIELATEQLKKSYLALLELYGCNIIFEKYHDFVAVSSFYEYLLSGRCETLEGATGAYNLYESESRANIIIQQLSRVIELLEDIKENQFVIYSAIDNSHKQLWEMNCKMDGVLYALEKSAASLDKIKTNTDTIKNNTEIIAYNTAITSFYAKKNAEITNSLGYLMALS